jgi:hypothetical protein
VQQRELGKQCSDLNLLKETIGKIGELGKESRVRCILQYGLTKSKENV